MDNPCKSCSRQGDCDHFFRCKRWRDWFTNQWQTIKELFSM